MFCNRIIHPPAEERYISSACEITMCQVVYACYVFQSRNFLGRGLLLITPER